MSVFPDNWKRVSGGFLIMERDMSNSDKTKG